MRKTLALLIIGAILTGCGSSDAEGGPMVSRNYHVGAFSDFEIAGSYDVEIRTGQALSVSARGPENVLNRLKVNVEGNKLIIRPESQNGWFHVGRRTSQAVHILVTVPNLTSATLEGSGAINIDKVQGARFEGTVEGSGQLNLTNVDVRTLKLSIAGSGDAKAGQGKAQTAEFEIAGSGSLDATAVHTQQLKVAVTGSGGVRANASSTAQVDIMGSGDADISGGAKCTVNKSGSGNARCS